MRFNAKRSWLAIGAISVASLGCGHTRSEKQDTPSCSSCGVIVANRSGADPSVPVAETPGPASVPHHGGVTVPPQAMPTTITPSTTPSVPATPAEMPRGTLAPMPSELPRTSSLPQRNETSLQVSTESITRPTNLPVDAPKPVPPSTATPTSSVTREKTGRASDYSWMVGRLEHSKNKQTWRVRYASHEVEDDFGGSVTLVGADDVLERYADGDLVKVDGQLLDPEQKTSAPPYRVRGVRKLN